MEKRFKFNVPKQMKKNESLKEKKINYSMLFENSLLTVGLLVCFKTASTLGLGSLKNCNLLHIFTFF